MASRAAGRAVGVNTLHYSVPEIERVARVAFEACPRAAGR